MLLRKIGHTLRPMARSTAFDVFAHPAMIFSLMNIVLPIASAIITAIIRG